MENIVKLLNLLCELLLWVGLWNIYENILSRFTLSKNVKLFIYLMTILVSLSIIYLINDDLQFKNTLY